jgi:hypothetical protein
VATKWAYLRAWNWMFVISEEAVQAKIRKAEEEGAPERSVYKSCQGWITVDDIKSPILRREIEDRANGRAQDTADERH